MASPRALLLFSLVAAPFVAGSTCHYHSGHHHDGHYHDGCYHDGYHDEHCDHYLHGGVVVLITDNPRGDVRAFYVTIREALLLSDDLEPREVFRSEEGHRVNLLSLRGDKNTRLHEVLVTQPEFPAGSYDSIRLFLSDPTLVLASGEVVGASEIDVVGGGQVVLDLLEPVVVGPAGAAFLVLDFDVERSINFDGEKGRWQLRPVILADVMGGQVRDRIATPTDLCGSVVETDLGVGLLTIELPDDRGPVEVDLNDAVLLGADLEPAPFEAIEPRSPATVRGHWTPEGRLEAERVVLDETLQVIGGILGRAMVAGETLLYVEPVGGQAVGGLLPVRVGEEVLLSWDRLEIADPDDLHRDLQVMVTASARRGAREVAWSAPFVDLKRELRPRPEDLKGQVVSVLGASRVLYVWTGAELQSVNVASDAEILRVGKVEGSLLQGPLSFAEIEAGMRVEADASGNPAGLLVLSGGR